MTEKDFLLKYYRIVALRRDRQARYFLELLIKERKDYSVLIEQMTEHLEYLDHVSDEPKKEAVKRVLKKCKTEVKK